MTQALAASAATFAWTSTDTGNMAISERSEHSLAIFIDFENLALGFQGRRDRFDIHRVLTRMVEKGKIVAKKAYADWNRYSSYTAQLHEAAIELVEIPRRMQSGKNSADIRLVVDAMDLAYSKEHIDTFVIVSGDSDFSPLVSKLKELGKHVIGHGMQGSTSELLRDNCDEFIYYEDLEDRSEEVLPSIDASLPETKRKAFALLLESLLALRRENKVDLWSSMVKDTMKRKKPSFNETYHGYSSFSALLEDAQRHGLIELETHKRSGTYVVSGFGEEIKKGRRPAAPERERLPRPRMDVPEPPIEATAQSRRLLTADATDIERTPPSRRPPRARVVAPPADPTPEPLPPVEEVRRPTRRAEPAIAAGEAPEPRPRRGRTPAVPPPAEVVADAEPILERPRPVRRPRTAPAQEVVVKPLFDNEPPAPARSEGRTGRSADSAEVPPLPPPPRKSFGAGILD